MQELQKVCSVLPELLGTRGQRHSNAHSPGHRAVPGELTLGWGAGDRVGSPLEVLQRKQTIKGYDVLSVPLTLRESTLVPSSPPFPLHPSGRRTPCQPSEPPTGSSPAPDGSTILALTLSTQTHFLLQGRTKCQPLEGTFSDPPDVHFCLSLSRPHH